MKRGDAIASVAQPIAKGIDWALNTDLQNCSGCNKIKSNLNAGMSLADALYDRFWPSQPKKNNNNAIHNHETNRS
jgi:hypothetical protein